MTQPNGRRLPARASLRARLLVLMLVAAIPVLVLAVLITVQDANSVRTRALDRLNLVRQTIALTDLATLTTAHGVLAGLARMSPLVMPDPAGADGPQADGAAPCSQILGQALALHHDQFAGLAMYDGAGHRRCQALAAPAAGMPLLPQRAPDAWLGAAGSGLAAARIARDPQSGQEMLVLTQPFTTSRPPTAGPAGVLALWLRLPLPVQEGNFAPAADWLAGPAGKLVADGSTPDRARPRDDLLPRLLQGRSVLSAMSAGGVPFIYASDELGAGLRLVVGVEAAAQDAAFRMILIQRGIEIGALLLLSLAAIWAGTRAAVITPVKLLDDHVRRWRSGEYFTPDTLRQLPRELREVAHSFQQAAADLVEREAQLSRALATQDLLMQEIHHRVKNNLQIVASLLNLQASRLRQPEARAEFQSARDRVRALATLHRHLYVHGDMQTINMRSFLVELCGQMFQAMGETEGRRIMLEIDAPELQLSSDQAVPLALIVTETVSNALKYAFPVGRSGRISVTLTADGETAHLLVSDDGVGMRNNRADTPDGPRDGLGLQLIRGFARQLGATLRLQQAEGAHGGTSYALDIPLHRAAPGPVAGAGHAEAIVATEN